MEKKSDDAYRVPPKADPVIEAITHRIGPPALVLMLKSERDQSMTDDAVELLCQLVEQLVIVAVRHGAPTTPEWWDFVADHIARVSDQLEAERARYAEMIESARDLARRGFIEVDEEREVMRQHPRWAGVPKEEVLKAVEASYDDNP